MTLNAERNIILGSSNTAVRPECSRNVITYGVKGYFGLMSLVVIVFDLRMFPHRVYELGHIRIAPLLQFICIHREQKFCHRSL